MDEKSTDKVKGKEKEKEVIRDPAWLDYSGNFRSWLREQGLILSKEDGKKKRLISC